MPLDPFANMLYTQCIRKAAPREVCDKLIVAVRSGEHIFVWLSVNYPVVFDYSEDFPTELDIARLCVECP